MTIPVTGKILLQVSSTDAAPIRRVLELIQLEEERLLGPIVAPSEKSEQNQMLHLASLAFGINGVRAMLNSLIESMPDDEKAKLQTKKESLHPLGWS